MQVLKAVGAALILTALIAGVPALLLMWGRPQALWGVEWSTVLFRPDTGTVVLGLLSIVGWAAWLILSAATVAETFSQLSHRRWRPHVPGVSWLQPVVGGLVAMAMTPLLSTHADEPAPTTAPIVVVEQPAERRPPATAAESRNYVVLPGDELWGVAERELGAGSRWRSIVDSNPGMTSDTPMVPGRIISLPVTGAASASAAPGSTIRVIVRRGDTLWDLAREHLGDPQRWPEIFEANRKVIADPDEIDVGWELTIALPPRPATEPPEVVEPPPLTMKPATPRTIEQEDATKAPIPPPVTKRLVTTAAVTAPASSAPTGSTPATSRPPETLPHRVDRQQTAEPVPGMDILGSMGAVLAAGLLAGVAARRRVQLLHRGIGRRIPTLSPQLQRFFTALVRRSSEAADQQPSLHPSSVVVGWNDQGDVHVDVESEGCTLLVGSDEDTAGMAATILTSLLSAEWSTSVEVVAVQPQDDWASALDDPRLVSAAVLDEALDHLQRTCAERRLRLAQDTLEEVRADQNRAHAWAPLVFVFCSPLYPGHLDRIHDCLSLGKVGVGVVAATASLPPGDGAGVLIDSPTRARMMSTGAEFHPQLLTRPARHAVMSLFAAALAEEDQPAPWWHDGATLPHPTVTVLPKKAEEPLEDDEMPTWSPPIDHPYLQVLGPVELRNTRGTPPLRAAGQCVEYCAWLLLHPGATPMAMVRDLLVAEGTRRSNMSRLRTWLGDDPHGMPYLPDAYSGHIALADGVTSDWERFQSLLAGGVNLSSTPLLREALSLVRGQPLEGVTFQWPWVAQWLTDMLSMITDAATVLADRCLTEADPAGALWAIDQGLNATGDDETLTVRRIQASAAAGNRPEVEAAVTRLTRAARAENRDLTADSIRRIQQALHAGKPKPVTLQRRPNISIHDSEGRPVG